MEEFTAYNPPFSIAYGTRQAKDIVSDFRDGSFFIPDSQREYSYNAEQKTSVIVSLIRGLSIDSITIVQRDKDKSKYSICDGAHRVRVLDEFLSDGFALRLKVKGIDNLGLLNGKKFSQLPVSMQGEIKRKEISIVTIIPKSFDLEAVLEAENAVVEAKNTCALKMPKDQRVVFDYAAKNQDVRFIKSTVSSITKEAFSQMAISSAIALALNSAAVNAAILLSVKYARFVHADSREQFADRFRRSVFAEAAIRKTKGYHGNFQVIAKSVTLGVLCALFTTGDHDSFLEVKAVIDRLKKCKAGKGKGVVQLFPHIVRCLCQTTKAELRYSAASATRDTRVFGRTTNTAIASADVGEARSMVQSIIDSLSCCAMSDSGNGQVSARR